MELAASEERHSEGKEEKDSSQTHAPGGDGQQQEATKGDVCLSESRPLPQNRALSSGLLQHDAMHARVLSISFSLLSAGYIFIAHSHHILIIYHINHAYTLLKKGIGTPA